LEGRTRLVDDIAENGIQESIKVVEHNGSKYVVDGHHRLAAARQLGIKRRSCRTGVTAVPWLENGRGSHPLRALNGDLAV
jgi:ParB-like chromosome segregation protein Spo0J